MADENPPRSSGHIAREKMLQMIYDEVKEVRKDQKDLRDKIEEASRDNRKFTEAKLKDLDQRIKERERAEFVTLKEANVAQDVVIAALKKDVEAVTKWADGMKARLGLIVGGFSLFGGAIMTGVVALAKHLAG